MSQITVWLDGFTSEPEPAARLIQELKHSGVDCYPSDPQSDRPSGSGLVLFDRCRPELVERIWERSQRGEERLVAVALGREALTGGQGWQLLAAGASDVLAWRGAAEIAAVVAARFERWQEIDRLVASPAVERNLVGRSPVWRSVLRQLVEVARFSGSPVLLEGESGTGKELFARLVQTLDPRPDKRDLVVLDCTTIVPELSGSEFFGHERGAFTGAVAARDGAFALADGGTLFLDEVGELSIPLQAELLRVVQEGTYKRVGSGAWHRTRFRLVCATNRDLQREVAAGRFRRDFYSRVAAWSCRLPPLRERREDIPLLVRHFLREHFGAEAPEVDPEVLGLLLARDYPGNVRDLKQLVGRIAHRHVGPGPITPGDVPESERPPEGRAALGVAERFEAAARFALAQGLGLKEIGGLATEAAVRLAIDEEGGNLRRASQRLGVTDRALQMRRAARRHPGKTREVTH